MQFDRKKLEPLVRTGIQVGFNQLRLNHRRLGEKWQVVLEEVVRRAG
jgi:hypothetical protein